MLMMRRPELIALLRDGYGMEADGLRGRTVQELRKTLDDLKAEGIEPGVQKKRIVAPLGTKGGRSEYAKRVLRRANPRM